MSGFDAFVCDEYYEAWATTEVEAGRQPTQLRFLQEFGTPYLIYWSKERKYTPPKYITIPQGTGVRINFKYFSDMKLRFPDVRYIDPTIQYIDDAIIPLRERVYKWVSGLFNKQSKSSTVTPVST
jgi:hypothetical protein